MFSFTERSDVNAFDKLLLPQSDPQSPDNGLEVWATSPPMPDATDSIMRVVLAVNHRERGTGHVTEFVVFRQSIWNDDRRCERGSGRYFQVSVWGTIEKTLAAAATAWAQETTQLLGM